jgi:hypothetical protein
MSGEILGPPELILGDGRSESRFNVLITGDGFADTDEDRELLNAHVAFFVEALQQEDWFQVLGSVINVYQLNIASTDSGVTEPVRDAQWKCTGDVISRSTYFEANYPCGADGEAHHPFVNEATVAALHDPEVLPFVVHVIGIVINTSDFGGGRAPGSYFVAGAPAWTGVAIHEFTHVAFNVRDEDDDDTLGTYGGGEPSSPNVTKATSLDTLKWKHFIFPNVPSPPLQNPNVPIPTLLKTDCSVIEVLPNPLDDDFQIGLFEGAFHHSCGIYRPAYTCKMRVNSGPLCRVCIDAGLKNLSTYAPQVPTPHAEVITSDGELVLDFGDVPLAETTYRSFEIRNTREGWPAPLYVGLSGQVRSETEVSIGTLRSQQRVSFTLDAVGPIEATLTWGALGGLRIPGHIAAATQTGPTPQVEIPLEIIADGEFTASLEWTSTDVNLDLQLRDSFDSPVGVSTSSTETFESLSYIILDQASFGTYKLVVTNNSEIETDFFIAIGAGCGALAAGRLLDPNGVAVATFAPATSPARLFYDAPAGSLGEYTFEFESNFWPVNSYQLDYSYPKSDPQLQGPFAFDPRTETTFIVPAPVIDEAWSRKVFIGFTAPDRQDEFSTTFDLYTSDPANARLQIELRGTSVEPQPLDSVLVIDHSQSMAEPTGIPNVSKSEMAASAGKLFVSLLRDDDRIGIVQFNQASDDPADILLDMTVADVDGKRAADRALDAVLQPSGTTSIGAGIIRGSTILDQPAILPLRAILVLTDGIQNTSPDIAEAQAVVVAKRPAQNVFAIGFGLNQLESTLAEIATATNGWAQITGELAGWKEFILQKLYVQILADAANETIVKDPREVVLAGESRSTDVYLSQFDHSADFIVLFSPTKSSPRQASVVLETPSGELVRWGDPVRSPGIKIIEGDSHVCFRVSRFGKKEKYGLWRVWVENRSSPSGSNTFKEALVYAVICKARSDLRLKGQVEQLSVRRGEPLTVVFDPILSGRRYQPSGPSFAFVQLPRGSIERIELTLTPSGCLRGVIKETKARGPYLIWTELHFPAPHKITTTRFRQVCGLVLDRKPKRS